MIAAKTAIQNKIQEVKKDEWGNLTVTTKHGDQVETPCHYIDF